MPAAASRVRLLEPLRLRGFRTLWAGMTVSLIGDGVTLVAIAWQVYQLSNVPTALGLTAAAMAIPHVLLLLVGGAVSDRVERRRVMLAADLVRGAALMTLGVLSLTGALQIWHMILISACYGAGSAFFGPAFDAIVPDLVPEDLLPQANSLDQFVRPIAARLVGPAIGGWIIAVTGVGWAFMIDAGTFAVSVCCLVYLRFVQPPILREAGIEDTSTWAEIKEGFAFVRSRVWLWGTLLAATLSYLVFLGPAEILLPYLVKNDLGGSAADLGTILAAGGIGAVTASLFMAHRGIPARTMTFIYLAWTASTLMVAGYGIARSAWQLMAVCFAFNLFETAGLIVWLTLKQTLVPARLLGRVSSFDWFISVGLMPVSYALAGPVAGLLGIRETLVAAGVLGATITLGFMFLPGIRDVERIEPVSNGIPTPPGGPTQHPDPALLSR